MSSGTRSRSPPRNGPTLATGGDDGDGDGGSKRMHGFSVAAASPEDGGDDSAVNAQKRPREASLPSANPSSMTVVLPSGKSGGGVSPAASSTSAVSPVAPTTIVGISDSLSDYNRSKAGVASEDYYDSEEEEEASPPPPPPVEMPSFPRKLSKAPAGKVVETGQEHTGRWTKEEHDDFLVGLKMYGKEWKKVAAKVKTRTVVQTRTHAQKYFQKLQKVMKSSGGKAAHVEMGVTTTPILKTAPKKQISPINRPQRKIKPKERLSPDDGYAKRYSPPSRPRAASQGATDAAAHILQMSAMKSLAPPGGGHYSSSPPSDMGPPPPYSMGAPPSASSSWEYQALSSSMKIVAPEHDSATKRGKFPEPSPAACGKRKLAEIAAAQMLAGVMSTSEKRKRPSNLYTADGTTTPPPEGSSSQKLPPAGGAVSLQIVNPDDLDSGKDSQKKKMQGMPSPMTPWDGQLQALVGDVRIKEGDDDSESGLPGLPNLHADQKEAASAKEPETMSADPLRELESRSALHKAVCSGSVGEVSKVLDDLDKDEASKQVNQQDGNGFFPLHSAAATCLPEVDSFGFHEASEIVRMLLSAGANVAACDGESNTSLHWAARVGNDELTQSLLMNRCPVGLPNQKGETALHWALRSGSQGMSTARLLLQNGAKISMVNRSFKRPIDVAAKGFDGDDAFGAETIGERRQTRANFLENSPQSRTLILHHPDCLGHMPKSSADWEAPDRVTSIMDRITTKGSQASSLQSYEISVSSDFDRAPLELLSRVHSAEYLQFVNDLSKELESRRKKQIIRDSEARNTDGDDANGGGRDDVKKDDNEHHVVPFTPMIQKKVIREAQIKEGEHSDTSFSAGSLKAARRAAGAVQHAVDRVLVGRNRNAFCAVRPPGHHAGVNGLLAGGESCGFCIFNSVAAGAMHALSDDSHRPRCERVAIVDIDAHHGNGTEEIIKKCHDPGRLFFFSVHIFDHDKKKSANISVPTYKFYPGTGDEDDVANNIINVPIAPMWKEKEVSGKSTTPKATSTEPIRTRGRSKRKGSSSSVGGEKPSPAGADKSITSDTESVSVDESPTNGGLVSSKNATATSEPARPAHYLLGTGRMAYRRAVQQRLLPSLRAFNPDLILLSSGFDASRGDVGNARHYIGGTQRMGIDLEPEDYAWTTRRILEIADICCQGRVVSVLEGGYGRTSRQQPQSAAAAAASDNSGGDSGSKLPELDKSVFAECAFQHVQALVDPFDE